MTFLLISRLGIQYLFCSENEDIVGYKSQSTWRLISATIHLAARVCDVKHMVKHCQIRALWVFLHRKIESVPPNYFRKWRTEISRVHHIPHSKAFPFSISEVHSCTIIVVKHWHRFNVRLGLCESPWWGGQNDWRWTTAVTTTNLHEK